MVYVIVCVDSQQCGNGRTGVSAKHISTELLCYDSEVHKGGFSKGWFSKLCVSPVQS